MLETLRETHTVKEEEVVQHCTQAFLTLGSVTVQAR